MTANKKQRHFADCISLLIHRQPVPECDCANIKELVDRFLTWPLPESVCSDPCVTTPGYPNRIGTNLLTATEAEAMLRHVLGTPDRSTK